MTQFTYDFEDDESPILIEVTETATTSQGGTVSDTSRMSQRIKASVVQAKDELMKSAYRNIYRFARYTASLIKKVRETEDTDVPLKQVEIEFGIKFVGETDAIITKAGAESHLNIRMTWERKP